VVDIFFLKLSDCAWVVPCWVSDILPAFWRASEDLSQGPPAQRVAWILLHWGSMASADFWFSGAVSPVLILQKRYRLFKIERIKASIKKP